VAAKKEKPHWGARKIRDRLLRRLPHAIKVPAASTVHAVLDRFGYRRLHETHSLVHNRTLLPWHGCHHLRFCVPTLRHFLPPRIAQNHTRRCAVSGGQVSHTL
jgi:hypothetical protein